ncbi:TetR/AcrR family transcriptional regulator [Leucobacter sp. 7(1)]|uniref:TetR/AcrR family transcriptional regulator n=1 Tax=Leucobacter sp. 7(1) TaxID=1255613 RepID=UPI001595647B|nr:TetR/AcrR family transcriptional regulator [Leucobacter sp. 7(1)]
MRATEKTDHILDSSLAVFCRYGFTKTTMKDLADAAGISRASLYLHFSNKEDLFRAGSERAHASVMSEVEARLDGTAPVVQRVTAAMTSYLQGLMEEISASPHGQELFDSNMTLSRDITLAARARITTLLASALADAAEAGEIELNRISATPAELAGLILATVEGVKASGGTGAQITGGVALFMRVLGEATSPQR